ncbi:MAG: VOC family protein [Phyllobacteriaceae bacterium]|nr:VOC family protein [Phyllobacteriaceae bacterium]
MGKRISTFLMFGGNAEEALTLYETLFDDVEVVSIERYGPEVAGRQGTVREARWRLAGQDFIAVDSPAEQPFAFTPCMSLFINCRDDAEIEKLFAALSEDGAVLMPLGDHGFSARFAWVSDRFGVSWQLNLE